MKRKKKETPYLDFYEKCIETGEMPSGGLCICEDIPMGVVNIFRPDAPVHYLYGLDWSWGYSGEIEYGSFFDLPMKRRTEIECSFTTFRQTIVLFLSCMNDEY